MFPKKGLILKGGWYPSTDYVSVSNFKLSAHACVNIFTYFELLFDSCRGGHIFVSYHSVNIILLGFALLFYLLYFSLNLF